MDIIKKSYLWIKQLVIKYQKIVKYLITGVLTTLVNYIVFFVLYYIANLNSTFSNSIAVGCAVIFAYVTNKIFVFESRTPSMLTMLREAIAFVASRGFTIALEIGGVFLLLEVLKFNAMISKIFISIFVVVINYFISRFLVFKK